MIMRFSALVLALCMIAVAVASCCNTGTGGSVTEETTVETTAEPTPTLTPAPTNTPTPTTNPVPEPFTELILDEDLVGEWNTDDGNGTVIVYIFRDDNSGIIYQSRPVLDAATMEEIFRDYISKTVFSVISPGVVRIATREDRYTDYEYYVDGDALHLEDVDHLSSIGFHRSHEFDDKDAQAWENWIEELRHGG